ncbi:hypothetical protein RH915_08140 [Serpentinicella sp. ANB-PHB4]|uniref:hypothetical protein n=1 Tax=Serpentinicella sp. ANB-PHB4 TaxID=3074076 RepID=UPI002856C079|nr:hypothetical protein [Serpentinicella sp. ANB-PHB4]MDR5659459.1 hypothetical protein [Serpentinicella sp. ANB-PHB4]
MIDEKIKSIKVVDELMNHCYKLGLSKMNINVEVIDNGIDITILGDCHGISKKEIETLNESLNVPRQEAVEDYYWELLGAGDQDELNLVGMVSEDGQAKCDNQQLKIKVFIKK